MTRRRKRSKEEIARWDRWHKFAEEDEEFYDYYERFLLRVIPHSTRLSPALLGPENSLIRRVLL